MINFNPFNNFASSIADGFEIVFVNLTPVGRHEDDSIVMDRFDRAVTKCAQVLAPSYFGIELNSREYFRLLEEIHQHLHLNFTINHEQKGTGIYEAAVIINRALEDMVTDMEVEKESRIFNSKSAELLINLDNLTKEKYLAIAVFRQMGLKLLGMQSIPKHKIKLFIKYCTYGALVGYDKFGLDGAITCGILHPISKSISGF